MSDASKLHASAKAASFVESVIREMTRIAQEHDAINLGQGFPDFPAPQALKDAAARAIAEDHNQYPITWGVPAFRDAIAAEYRRAYGMDVDPATEICVTCGSTEAVMATFLGVLDPGDEVVIFEPFYDNWVHSPRGQPQVHVRRPVRPPLNSTRTVRASAEFASHRTVDPDSAFSNADHPSMPYPHTPCPMSRRDGDVDERALSYVMAVA